LAGVWLKEGTKDIEEGGAGGEGMSLFSLSERRKEHSWSGVGLSRESVTVDDMCEFDALCYSSLTWMCFL